MKFKLIEASFKWKSAQSIPPVIWPLKLCGDLKFPPATGEMFPRETCFKLHNLQHRLTAAERTLGSSVHREETQFLITYSCNWSTVHDS